MPAAQILANGNERQLALEAYGLFGTQADEVFDSIISIAANICDVPISVISLIDRERQWFFARNGMPREETSRSDALCAHAILDYQLMEVFDARDDQRFSDSNLVTSELGIRFYAAQPITTPDGFKLGAICLIGHEPKELNSFQRKTLSQLSRIVITLFEARKTRLQQEQKLHYLATHDGLTALPNRVLGMEHLEKALIQAQKENSHMALLFVDLDNLKIINDTHGHAVGDAVIKESAKRLADSICKGETVARWGGDEFIVVLSPADNRQAVQAKLQQLQSVLAQKFTITNHSIELSASIGYAYYPEDGATISELLHRADQDMYSAKPNSQNS